MTVHLAICDDKRALVSPAIDCATRLHLCHARCCAFALPLSQQDVDEGKLEYDPNDLYWLKRDDDGYCTHLDRRGGGCTVYEHRPGACRQYDCRKDRRVWLDFDERVAAPMHAVVISGTLV